MEKILVLLPLCSTLTTMSQLRKDAEAYIRWFKEPLPGDIPARFTFPFYYTPHPLCVFAAEELMQELEQENDRHHNFGLNDEKEGIGKMFGILLVKNVEGKVGYLRAFSGKLANSNIHAGFVPPLFDMLAPDGFYIQGENVLRDMNAKIIELENSEPYIAAKQHLQSVHQESEKKTGAFREMMRINKEARRKKREEGRHILTPDAFEALKEELVRWSYHDQHCMKLLQAEWKQRVESATGKVQHFEQKIQDLKSLRKQKSAALQERLFEQYNFLNRFGETINVKSVFADTAFDNPPSGAGECATPKLLQFAFQHRLQPLAMAEFWWGKSPVSAIRKHRQYYPACRGKCEPILGHMLKGIEIDPNPMMHQPDLSHQLKTLYEDEQIVVVNKPAGMLSVPGKIHEQSVQSILEARYPDATGPLLVHRLDMSTSGILIAGKTKEAHQYLQAQFIKKTAKKCYMALLDGSIASGGGLIDLPLRMDIDNRPHQVVCFEHGKKALTKWELVCYENGKTRIYFYPISGRTHQLRVHAAHPLGLNTPIVGDDLYGNVADRLHLHAAQLTIKHPGTREEMTFECPAEF